MAKKDKLSKSKSGKARKSALNLLVSSLGFFSTLKRFSKKKVTETVYMCESTTKQDMLLYLNYNKYKYFTIRLLNGLLYAITRFSYIPILLSSIEHINLISVMCLVLLFAYSFKAKRIFTEDLKLMSWVLTIILICHTIHKYL